MTSQDDSAWLAAILGTVLAVLKWTAPPLFALSPDQWIDNGVAWIAFVLRRPLYVVIVCSIFWFVIAKPLSGRSAGMRRGWRRGQVRLEYLAPKVQNGMRERVPQGVEERVIRILNDVSSSNLRGLHEIRLLVVTGQHTLDYLETLIHSYPVRGRWFIRVLMLDPNVPAVELLAKGSRANIHASVEQLMELRAHAEGEQKPITLEWRGYSQLPLVRGFSVDDDHLFWGLTAWHDADPSPRMVTPKMHTQGRWLVYLTSRAEFGRKAIESFHTWFDYQWKYATRDLGDDGIGRGAA